MKRGKMISIKWVITHKGTEEHPIAKASLVEREFNKVRCLQEHLV